ncbi:dual specificity phosphatase, catalytic domain-containing protein [Besnoitia besnoiti]|uniref:protein-tyrosine-phosphatase n=1 Tax=Besnoitia besnoiti TaxID=94643 RepID=A0A2A9MJJ4_BESBE|nr:dual specificity phosphatase, catalytic domain-containing protein [Besnoitia besnoiti]PFH35552.1 dual specificity phosphatase, catalytic domain-containing protein [Besnoitia besnoiti]
MAQRFAGSAPGGGAGGPAFSFFAHFSPLSGQQKQAAHQILPHLFLGSAAAARSSTWLQQNRITHIVCVHNADASPQELKRQLISSRSAAADSDSRGRPPQQRPQTVAEQLVVHGDRCVYCCCFAQDTPQHVLLPALSPVISFIDSAIQDQSFRGGGSSAAGPPASHASGLRQNAPPRKAPKRNHVFISGVEQTGIVDEDEGDTSRSPGRVAAHAGDSGRNGVYGGASKEAPRHGNVLVHCAKGISRSASFVICYLMFRRCWSYNDSFTFIRRKRPIYPNVGFQIQLKEVQQRLEQFRPTIPRVDGVGGGAAPQRITAAAVAAGLVRDDADEPDLFRRDPTAAEKLLDILTEARDAVDASSLEQKLVASILKRLLATQELVETMFTQPSLLRDRQKWEDLGLFFENLKSYCVPASPDILVTAQKVAKRASDLKLVFTATLPGVAMADTVAEEIRRWTQVAEEQAKKAKATDGPKQSKKFAGSCSAAPKAEKAAVDGEARTKGAQTSLQTEKTPREDEKSRPPSAAQRDGGGSSSRQSNSANDNAAESAAQSARVDRSEGRALSSANDLFGGHVSSTAITLREKLRRLREKRAAFTDQAARGPAADQGVRSRPGDAHRGQGVCSVGSVHAVFTGGTPDCVEQLKSCAAWSLWLELFLPTGCLSRAASSIGERVEAPNGDKAQPPPRPGARSASESRHASPPLRSTADYWGDRQRKKDMKRQKRREKKERKKMKKHLKRERKEWRASDGDSVSSDSASSWRSRSPPPRRPPRSYRSRSRSDSVFSGRGEDRARDFGDPPRKKRYNSDRSLSHSRRGDIDRSCDRKSQPADERDGAASNRGSSWAIHEDGRQRVRDASLSPCGRHGRRGRSRSGSFSPRGWRDERAPRREHSSDATLRRSRSPEREREQKKRSKLYSSNYEYSRRQSPTRRRSTSPSPTVRKPSSRGNGEEQRKPSIRSRSADSRRSSWDEGQRRRTRSRSRSPHTRAGRR